MTTSLASTSMAHLLGGVVLLPQDVVAGRLLLDVAVQTGDLVLCGI